MGLVLPWKSINKVSHLSGPALKLKFAWFIIDRCGNGEACRAGWHWDVGDGSPLTK